MKALLALLLLVGVAFCQAARIHGEQREPEEHEFLREEKKEHESLRDEKKEERKVEEKIIGKLEQKIVEKLEEKKKVLGVGDSFIEEVIDYFMKDPVTKMDKQCFDKLKPGQSIDFIIDLAPSPSKDPVDKFMSEQSPFSKLLYKGLRSPSRSYFDAVQTFIDGVTIGMSSERTHSLIVDHNRKYFLKGRNVDDVEMLSKLKSTGEFTDVHRNLKTLWPVPTKEGTSYLGSLSENSLGYMTKLTLWNRNNGLPVVLSGIRHSKPIYSIIITDGSSTSKISDLVDDFSRTSLIDIGNRRFVKDIPKDIYSRLLGVYTLTAPQRLPMLIDSIRYIACRQVELASESPLASVF